MSDVSRDAFGRDHEISVEINVEAMRNLGPHRGKDRYIVRCLTCSEIIAEHTPNPDSAVNSHLYPVAAWALDYPDD